MRGKRSIYEDREEAIHVALKRGGRPISGDALYELVQSFFSGRRQFSGTIGGLARMKKIVVTDTDGLKLYALPVQDAGAMGDPVSTIALLAQSSSTGESPRKRRRSAAESKQEAPLRIDQLFTRQASAMVAALRAQNAAPYAVNSPDKSRGGDTEGL